MMFDLRIPAILVFLWGVFNLSDGIIAGNSLNIIKGGIAIILAAYLYYHSQKIVILYRE